MKLNIIAAIAMTGLVSCSILSPSVVPATPMQQKDKESVLAAHNAYRAQHHAPKLVWDDSMARYATRYASKCKFQHSHGPYGENLAAGFKSVNLAVSKWYNEKNQYSFSNPGFSKTTGHFTQLVWKSTERLGCGYVSCNGENGIPGKYLVCEYSPAGNVINEGFFEENVQA